MVKQLRLDWPESAPASGDRKSPAGGDAASLAREAWSFQRKEPYMKTYSGWVRFAAVVLFIRGVLNVSWASAAIAASKFFVQDQKYILSNLNVWGWITLIIGLAQLFGAFSLWSGGLYGLFIAILMASISAVASLLSIPAYPFWSLAVFALDIIVIYQVSLYGGAGVENDDRSAARVQAARRDAVT